MNPPFPVEEYKMIRETSADAVNRMVNRHLQDGWVIWGYPSSSSSDYTQYYSQAMIKFKSPSSRFVDENHPVDEAFPPEHFQL